MALADIVIVWVVRGRDLDGTCSKPHVDSNRVGDDRYATVQERMLDEFAMKMLAPDVSIQFFNRRRLLTVYLLSSGCTAIAVSPSIVSTRVVATIIDSSAISAISIQSFGLEQ